MKNYYLKKLMLGVVAVSAMTASVSATQYVSSISPQGTGPGRERGNNFASYSGSLYSYYSYDNSSNTAGSVLTGSDTMRTRTNNAYSAIETAASDMTGAVSSGNTTMVNGGGCNDNGRKLWAGLGWSNIRNDVEQYEYNMNFWTGSLGGDIKLWNDRVLLGLAAHYTFMKGDTEFNKGSLGGNAYGVNPYLALKIVEMNGFKVSVLAIGGWEHVSRNDYRTNLRGDAHNTNGTLVNTFNQSNGDLSRISSKPKSDTVSGKVSLVLAKAMAKADVSLSVGYAYMQDKVKAFTETGVSAAGTRNAKSYLDHKFKVSQLQTRLAVGYMLSDSTRPYVAFIYNNDLNDQTMFTFDKQNRAAWEQIKENTAKKSELGGALGLCQMVGDSMRIDAEYGVTFKGKLTTQSTNAKLVWKF